jgi:predicted DsbA family dithiol-disulfide isomerase
MTPDDTARTLRTMTAAESVDAPPDLPRITVDIWSDVVCPWCYIGKRRFERALAELDGELEVDVRYRPYQLDPTASPGKSQPVVEAYAKKFGGPEQARAIIERVTRTAADDGLDFRMDLALRANTLLAHRLLWWAEQPGSPVEQAALKERLLRAYFVEGRDVGDPETLAELTAELGVESATVLAFLESDGGADDVRTDLRQAAELGITAVPTFVLNGQWAIPGAQDPDTFVNVLRRLGETITADTVAAATTRADDDRTCTDDVCDV